MGKKFLSLFFSIFFLIFSGLLLSFSFVKANAFSINVGDPTRGATVYDLVDYIMDIVFKFTIITAPLIIIIAAGLFAVSSGDAARMSLAKKIIIITIVSLAIVLLARGISSVVKSFF